MGSLNCLWLTFSSAMENQKWCHAVLGAETEATYQFCFGFAEPISTPRPVTPHFI